MPITEPVTDDPFAEMSTHDLETELLGLAGHIAAAQCRFLQLLAAYDSRAGWAGPGLRSCAHWLSWRIGMSLRTATEHVRVAHALTDLPLITEAFAAGRISYSKVRAITRVTPGATGSGRDVSTGGDAGSATGDTGSGHDEVQPEPHTPGIQDAAEPAATEPTTSPPPADAESTLLNLALAGTAGHVETVVRALRRRQTLPAATAAQRTLTWHWAEDGSLVLRGLLTPTDGAALIAAVDALVPSRVPVTHPAPPPPDGWRDRAVEHAPGAVTDRLGARRADALLALATGTASPDQVSDRAAGNGGGEGTEGSDEGGGGVTAGRAGAGPVVARGQARIVVHVDIASGTARISGGPEIPHATAERLACDAEAQVLLTDTRSNRLYLGRNRRLASPAQIAALTLRDGGRCQFPGCTHIRHLHAHHVQPWMRGGRTDVDNLVLLCSFHRTVLHDRGYRIRRLPDRWEVRRPDGTLVDDAGGPLTGDVERLIEIDTRAGLQITRDSLTPTWAGERLDPTPILDALLPRPEPSARAA